MSDVVVNVTESTTAVTVSEQSVAVAIIETPVQISASTAGLQGVPGANNDPTYVTVRNATGSLLAKGSIVYISGGNGTHTQVSKALATSDSTSIRALGWLSEDIANNASGLCCVEGYLDGVNTQGIAEGSQLYLSAVTAGGFTATVPSAPIHTVYVGVCIKASAGNGRVFVKVQNGYGLNEIHDVLIASPANNQVLTYETSTGLWKNKTPTGGGGSGSVTSITADSPLTGGTITSSGNIGLNQLLLSLTSSQISDFSDGTVASAGTAQQAGTAVYSTLSGTATYATLAGTAVYGTTSGTAVYSTLSGTAVGLSGSITRSQVSDYAGGTVANISGTVAQSQVTNLVSDLSGKATLGSANTFTVGGQIINNDVATNIPLVVKGIAGQSVDLLQVLTNSGTAVNITSGGVLRTTQTFQSTGLQNVSDGTTVATYGNKNIQFGGITGAFAGGIGVIGIGNATTLPTTPSANGGVLYSDAGALKYLGTSGSAATITNADGTTPQSRSDAKFFQGTTTIDVPSRMFITGLLTLVSGSLRGHLFTAEKNFTVTNIGMYVSAPAVWAGATSPQAKVGLFSVSGTTLTLIASSAFVASPFTVGTAITNFSISASLVAGTTYAVGLVASWTGTPASTPTLASLNLVGNNLAGLSPVMNFQVSATDIAGPYTAAGVNQAYYFRIS
jgi:hypothetical protein